MWRWSVVGMFWVCVARGLEELCPWVVCVGTRWSGPGWAEAQIFARSCLPAHVSAGRQTDPLKGLYSPFKGNIDEYKGFSLIFIVSVFPKFSTLELRNKIDGPQIRILLEIFSLEPAPKVWKPVSRSQNNDLLIFYSF